MMAWDPWVGNDLETMALDLQVILDELGKEDLDSMPVGEMRRICVMARAVRDGAAAVLAYVNPSLTAGSFHPSTVTTPGPYWSINTTHTGSDRGCA
jgi:hypothetical protein